jgi:putative membrane protein
MDKMTPFSIRKELEEDQNIALGIVMGAALIGIAIILGSVIQS